MIRAEDIEDQGPEFYQRVLAYRLQEFHAQEVEEWERRTKT